MKPTNEDVAALKSSVSRLEEQVSKSPCRDCYGTGTVNQELAPREFEYPCPTCEGSREVSPVSGGGAEECANLLHGSACDASGPSCRPAGKLIATVAAPVGGEERPRDDTDVSLSDLRESDCTQTAQDELHAVVDELRSLRSALSTQREMRESTEAKLNEYIEKTKEAESELSQMQAERDSARAQRDEFKRIGQQFERDSRRHFEQGCTNLERAESAERALKEEQHAHRATIDQRDRLHATYKGLYALWLRVARAMTPHGGPDITDEEVASRAESEKSARESAESRLLEVEAHLYGDCHCETKRQCEEATVKALSVSESKPREEGGCPPRCEGIWIGDGNTSGCRCVGVGCDCPHHQHETDEKAVRWKCNCCKTRFAAAGDRPPCPRCKAGSQYTYPEPAESKPSEGAEKLKEQQAERIKAEGGELFLGLPERWMGSPTWRCAKGHVSKRYLKSEARGDLCLECETPVVLTAPEDTESPPSEPSEGGER